MPVPHFFQLEILQLARLQLFKVVVYDWLREDLLNVNLFSHHSPLSLFMALLLRNCDRLWV